MAPFSFSPLCERLCVFFFLVVYVLAYAIPQSFTLVKGNQAISSFIRQSAPYKKLILYSQLFEPWK